jgi:hypothetical protein
MLLLLLLLLLRERDAMRCSAMREVIRGWCP